MVNEEDHLRIQLLLPACSRMKRRMANVLDDALEETLDYAFDESRGYLTTCPTNVGTGLRASLMVHLPALVMSKQAGKILNALSHVGLAVRGFYGEGTETAGNLFQISNQITLGLTEEEIINNLSSVAAQLIDQEKAARQALLKDYGRQLEDKVFRAYWILSLARIFSSDEALSILSHLRLGIDLGLIKEVDSRILNELMVLIQPAMLQGKYGRQMSPYERDLKRAEAIQDKLKK